jgi:hypothetical protein
MQLMQSKESQSQELLDHYVYVGKLRSPACVGGTGLHTRVDDLSLHLCT